MLACCASARNSRGRQRRWWKGDWTSPFHPHGQQCITESWLNVSRTTAPGRARLEDGPRCMKGPCSLQ
ncbi:hypothetical protein PVAP13_7KG120920 [Panicum virgatum]|uniref:Uncharacterized protein n=1 Tax=Panicum virgatum TaxID=38727 RepID=A0A8T0QMK6_PANVG|nr:hypothetical protein PVAP13_7KG120920 [Panicum virgatum]